jgi:hypothetical protein
MQWLFEQEQQEQKQSRWFYEVAVNKICCRKIVPSFSSSTAESELLDWTRLTIHIVVKIRIIIEIFIFLHQSFTLNCQQTYMNYFIR